MTQTYQNIMQQKEVKSEEEEEIKKKNRLKQEVIENKDVKVADIRNFIKSI